MGSSKKGYSHNDIDLKELINSPKNSNGYVNKIDNGEKENADSLGLSLAHEDEDDSYNQQEPGLLQPPYEDSNPHSSLAEH